MRHYGVAGGRALKCSKDPWEATIVWVDIGKCTSFLMSFTVWGDKRLNPEC